MKPLQTMACAIAFAVPHLAAAQMNSAEGRSAATTAATPTYQSAFENYRTYQDVPLADWRQVNDTVRAAATKGGGQGAHGAQQSRGSAGSAASKEAAPPPASAQHDMRQGTHGSRDMHGSRRMPGPQGMDGHQGTQGGRE
jgi:hypothetical protein